MLVTEKKLLKFEAEGQEFAIFLRSLEQVIQTVKGVRTLEQCSNRKKLLGFRIMQGKFKKSNLWYKSLTFVSGEISF